MHTVEPVYSGHLGTNQKCPDYYYCPDFPGQFIHIIKNHLGQQQLLSVWIMQVSWCF